MITVLIVLILVLIGLAIIISFGENLKLKKKILHLQKEIQIQNSRLDYQKKHSSDSANYFFSAVVIIMEMIGQINSVLKSEERDLPDKILQIIFEKAKDLIRPQRCILFKIDSKGNTCSCLYSSGYNDEELNNLNLSLDANNSFLGWSVATGRFFSFEDAGQDSLLSHLVDNSPLRCNYSQPIKVDNKVKAVLCVGALSQPLQEDVIVRLFSILSSIASVTLSNALLTSSLEI